MDEITVAVLNTSKEITEILEEAIASEGFKTSTGFTYEFKNKGDDFDRFVKENNPNVVVYDIAIPYQENFDLFKKLSKRTSAKNLSFILTTTNKEALESIVGKTSAYEIIGKPYDLQEVIDAVNSSINKSS